MKLIHTAKMKKRSEYLILFVSGILVFVLSNIYFGWNETAQSGAERVFDFIWHVLVVLGGFGVAVRSLIEEAFLDTEHDIKIEK